MDPASLIHDLVVCIDFDRTLSDESKIDALMDTACQAAGVDVVRIKNAKDAAEKIGESFSTLDYLYETESAEKVNEVKHSFTKAAQVQSPLYDDALPFLQALTDQNIAHLILTQGTKEWQELKIAASQLDKHTVHIISGSDKGQIISDWRTGAGLYHIPMLDNIITPHVVLVDDKAKCFASLPADCSGCLIRRPHEIVLPSQAGPVPANVEAIQNLLDCACIQPLQRL